MRSPRREHDGHCDAEYRGDVMTDPRMTVLVVDATDSIGRKIIGHGFVGVR
jgi:hypothetical protein